MTDLRFDDVVDTTSMIGPNGKYVQGICKTCSKQRKVYRDDFEVGKLYRFPTGTEFVSMGVNEYVLQYVCGMRTWNCCHENETPLDGFPDEPEV